MPVASEYTRENPPEDVLITEEFRGFRKEPGLSYLRFLADSAACANQADNESWEITRQPRGRSRILIRLNIGQWRAVDLWQDQITTVGIVVLDKCMSERERRYLKSLGAEIRRESIKLPGMRYVSVALSKMQRAAPMLATAHQAFIDIALDRWKGRSSWWRSHSVAVVRFLRKVLRRNDLLQPGYIKDLRDDDDGSLSDQEAVIDRSVEKYRTESAVIPPRQQAAVVFRREARLLTEYAAYLVRRREVVGAKAFEISGARAPIRCDLYNETREQLIEAKASCDRGAIRMAIGELLDYRRHIIDRSVRCAVLLLERPSADLEKLLSTLDFAVVWRTGRGRFADNAGGAFV